MGMYSHLMQGTGLLMVVLFMYIYFVPYKRLAAALRSDDYQSAGAHLAVIRRIILINLTLGLITAVIGGAGSRSMAIWPPTMASMSSPLCFW